MSAFMPMPPASNDQWTSGAPTRRVMFIGTGGVLTDTVRAAELRDLRLPPTALGGATTVVLDLVKTRNDWRVGDITWLRDGAAHTLRGIYVH